jgi:hypothetical protein
VENIARLVFVAFSRHYYDAMKRNRQAPAAGQNDEEALVAAAAGVPLTQAFPSSGGALTTCRNE